jgi:tRNA threonylcarbamoyladenosine biosynthesis protein TsaE
VLRVVSSSPEETKQLGRLLSRHLPERGIVLLIGDLGAGKTTLTKGIVEGLGVAAADEVTSPTYTIVHEYGDPTRVYHVDLYRLDTEQEVRALGFEELLERNALILVEWGERFPGLLPEQRIEITLTPDDDDNRAIVITGVENFAGDDHTGGVGGS